MSCPALVNQQKPSIQQSNPSNTSAKKTYSSESSGIKKEHSSPKKEKLIKTASKVAATSARKLTFDSGDGLHYDPSKGSSVPPEVAAFIGYPHPH